MDNAENKIKKLKNKKQFIRLLIRGTRQTELIYPCAQMYSLKRKINIKNYNNMQLKGRGKGNSQEPERKKHRYKSQVTARQPRDTGPQSQKT